MSDAINEEVQKASTDALVTLYELDTTPIGGTDIFRFTSMVQGTGNVVFGGSTYTAIDIEATGFEWDGRGAFPRPKIKVSNVAGMVSAAIIGQDDLIGSTLTRLRTFEQFLDAGSNPDPTALFPLEIYTVEQKVVQNKVYVEWMLSSILDQEGRKLPGRIALRDRCTHRYRLWDGAAFDYTDATCPYTGSLSYDENGDGIANEDDNCGRRLADCRTRFGETATLPTRAFPGIARVRVK